MIILWDQQLLWSNYRMKNFKQEIIHFETILV